MLHSRLPQGRCGLKYNKYLDSDVAWSSPSARKVWIEISKKMDTINFNQVAFRKEGVD